MNGCVCVCVSAVYACETEVKHFIWVCMCAFVCVCVPCIDGNENCTGNSKETWNKRIDSRKRQRIVDTLAGTLAYRSGTAHTCIEPDRNVHTMKNEINTKTFFTYYERIAFFSKSLSEQIDACTILTLATVSCFSDTTVTATKATCLRFHLLYTGDAMQCVLFVCSAHIIAQFMCGKL